jgi:hypothetical protein
LKVDIHENNKLEIEIDIKIQKDQTLINKFAYKTFTLKQFAPSTSKIREKYKGKSQREDYEKKLCNFDTDSLHSISALEKAKVKQAIIKESKKDHRFVTPAT